MSSDPQPWEQVPEPSPDQEEREEVQPSAARGRGEMSEPITK